MSSKFVYVGQYVTYDKCRNFFLGKCCKESRNLCSVEIRGFQGTGIF